MSNVVAPALLDTDVLSGVMRQHPKALRRAQDYLAAQARFSFSIMTRYEILRGLHAKRAVVQLEAFVRLCLAWFVESATNILRLGPRSRRLCIWTSGP